MKDIRTDLEGMRPSYYLLDNLFLLLSALPPLLMICAGEVAEDFDG